MKKFIIIIIAVIVISIVVVAIPKHEEEKTVSQETEETIDSSAVAASKEDTERLAFWFQHHDSTNHELVLLAELLWRLDFAAANGNNAERNKWYKECESALILGFDSIHPHTSLSNYEKADSMLSEIETFFELDADYSTMGMIVNLDLQNSFLIYRMTAEAIQILHYEPSFTKEIEAWNRLQENMNAFCLGVVNLDWFGGSGAGPASLATRNMIIQSRIDDLKNIHGLYAGNSFLMEVNNDNDFDAKFTKSESEFSRAIDKVALSISNVEDAKEYLLEDRLSDYKVLYDKVQGAKTPLVKSLKEWKRVRIKIVKSEANKQRKNALVRETVAAIDSLTKCVLDSQSNG